MSKILVFDCETTGLVSKGLYYHKDFDQFPHIVQLSWYFDGVFNDYIIYPDGYEIPEESVKIHGITTEIAKEKGHGIDTVLYIFLRDCNKSEKIIGFNIYFDTSVIKANILRGYSENLDVIELSNTDLDKSKRIDLMSKTIKFV